PELFGCRFAEDNRSISLTSLEWKCVADEQGNAQRLEIVWLNVTVVDRSLLISGGGNFSVVRVCGLVEAVEGSRGICNGNYAGQTGKALAKLTNQRRLLLGGVGFPVIGGVHTDDVFDVISGIHVERMNGAMNQHACGNQQ